MLKVPISCPVPNYANEKQIKARGSGILTLWVLKHLSLRGTQVGEGMGIWNSGGSSPSARGHATYHRTRLADLVSSWRGYARYARVHLLYHSGAWVSVWMLRVHGVALGEPVLLCHALVGRKRLGHHHCWAAKSPPKGLHDGRS